MEGERGLAHRRNASSCALSAGLTSLTPSSETQADLFDGDLYQATVCSVQVARDLLDLDLNAGGTRLSVHCGVGCGEVFAFHVGGVKDRWEYVITGDPVEQIGSASNERRTLPLSPSLPHIPTFPVSTPFIPCARALSLSLSLSLPLLSKS